MSEPALAAAVPKRVGLADLLRPPQVPSPAARAAAREAEAWRQGQAAARAEAASALATSEAANRALAETARQAEAVSAALVAETERAVQQAYAQSLASVALAIAKVVIGREPTTSPEMIEALMHDLVAAAPDTAAPRVRCHPDTLPLAAPRLPPGWTILTDAALDPLALVAELDAGELSASLAARLEQLAAHLGGPAA